MWAYFVGAAASACEPAALNEPLQPQPEPQAFKPPASQAAALGAAARNTTAVVAAATADAAIDSQCVMCLDAPSNVILAPCGHQCLCRRALPPLFGGVRLDQQHELSGSYLVGSVYMPVSVRRSMGQAGR